MKTESAADVVRRCQTAARALADEAWRALQSSYGSPQEQHARLLWALQDARASQMDMVVRMVDSMRGS